MDGMGPIKTCTRTTYLHIYEFVDMGPAEALPILCVSGAWMISLDEKYNRIMVNWQIRQVFLRLHQIAQQQIQLLLFQQLQEHTLISFLKNQLNIGIISAKHL